MDTLLSIKNYSLTYKKNNQPIYALEDIYFDILENEIVALVGESGCGKSSLGLSLMGLIDKNAIFDQTGEIIFEGKNLLTLTEKQFRKIRGAKIGISFQDPLSTLNPTMKIGKQIEEVFRLQGMTRKESLEKTLDLLSLVELPNTKTFALKYPHEISGGERQRVLIAIVLAANPLLLILDEPTTSIDASKKEVLISLLKKIQKERKLSILLITHDLGFAKKISDKIIVMYGGKIVEMGKDVLENPLHPYTRLLLQALPEFCVKEKLKGIPGSPPSLLSKHIGCPFFERCPHLQDICKEKIPFLQETASTKFYCHKEAYEPDPNS